jgi:hypothetical protein
MDKSSYSIHFSITCIQVFFYAFFNRFRYSSLVVIRLGLLYRKTKTNMKNLGIIITGITFLLPVVLSAQDDQGNKAGRLSPKEFSIPPSPVFDLMGVTPSLVNRTSDIKDFKVDWSFKDWKLNPNLAIQSQPIWEIFYNRKDLSRYQDASKLMRKLASIDVSVGTVQNEQSDRRIGFAVKMNIIRQKDPLMARELYEDIGGRFADEKEQLSAQLKELEIKLDSTKNILDKPGLRSQISGIRETLLSLNARRNEEINGRAKIFVVENWNAASLDIAFGRVYTYQTDSAGSLRKLRLNRNTGMGLWLNGGLPVGKKILVSGLARITQYDEQINFLLRNTNTFEETTETAVAENNIYSLGINLRYGSPIYSFFAEFLHERKSVKSAATALKKSFDEPVDREIIPSSVNWTILHPNSLTIGGDWRIGKNLMINYGMRWVFDNKGKTQAFIPVAGISCMMR